MADSIRTYSNFEMCQTTLWRWPNFHPRPPRSPAAAKGAKACAQAMDRLQESATCWAKPPDHPLSLSLAHSITRRFKGAIAGARTNMAARRLTSHGRKPDRPLRGPQPRAVGFLSFRAYPPLRIHHIALGPARLGATPFPTAPVLSRRRPRPRRETIGCKPHAGGTGAAGVATVGGRWGWRAPGKYCRAARRHSAAGPASGHTTLACSYALALGGIAVAVWRGVR